MKKKLTAFTGLVWWMVVSSVEALVERFQSWLEELFDELYWINVAGADLELEKEQTILAHGIVYCRSLRQCLAAVRRCA